MAKFPDGHIFIYKPKRTQIVIEERELVMCKSCKHWIGGGIDDKDNFIPPRCTLFNEIQTAEWFCPAGEREDT